MKGKRIIATLAACAVGLMSVPVMAADVEETNSGVMTVYIKPYGECGKVNRGSVTWAVSGGTMTVSGSGDMMDYSGDWSSLTFNNLVIENGVTAIGRESFIKNANLVTASLAESVTAIGMEAFRGCTSLASINLPKKLTVIDTSCFNGCTSLTSIDIPYGVATVRDNAFKGTGLTSVTLPASVNWIGQEAFEDCPNLTSVTVESMTCDIYGSAAFGSTGCTIYGYDGSDVQAYAQKNGYTFVSLGAQPPVTEAPTEAPTPTPTEPSGTAPTEPTEPGGTNSGGTTPGGANPGGSTGTNLPADVDGDGDVSTADASLILSDLAGSVLGRPSSFSAAQQAAADMDGGGISTSDVSVILQYLSAKVLNPAASIQDYVTAG